MRSGRGPESSTVDGVLTSGCCGWSRPPDAREFFEAIQADDPTKRQLAVGSAFIDEADINEILMAHLEGAFTWRQTGRCADAPAGTGDEPAEHVPEPPDRGNRRTSNSPARCARTGGAHEGRE